MNENFNFNTRLKRVCFILIAIGLASLIGGFIYYGENAVHRVWANLLLDSVFFMEIGMGAAFFFSSCLSCMGRLVYCIQKSS